MNAIDLTNSLVWTHLINPVSSATNNAASAGFDTRGYEGMITVDVAAGIRSAGDAGSQFVLYLQGSDTNAASNATNAVAATGLGAASLVYTGTTNNTASVAQLTYDPRANHRYLFLRTVITGGNSPAAPVSAVAVGQLQQQPT